MIAPAARSGSAHYCRTLTAEDDLQAIAGHIRVTDRKECEAALGMPLDAALASLLQQHLPVQAIFNTQRALLALWGVNRTPQDATIGAAWGMLADLTPQEGKMVHALLLREARHALGEYRALWFIVSPNNTLHFHWLKRIGAKLIAYHRNYGPPQREAIMEFIITKETFRMIRKEAV